MAKEIVAWCDVHLENDEHIAASTFRPALDGRAVELDLCDVCSKQYIEPLRELMQRFGQPVVEESKTTKQVQCPQCSRKYANTSALSKHMTKVHGVTVAESITEPLTPDERTLPYGCPEDSCSRRFSTPQGLGAHRSRAHGYSSGDDELSQAV